MAFPPLNARAGTTHGDGDRMIAERLARYRFARGDGFELGYSGAGMEQRMGGDCSGMG